VVFGADLEMTKALRSPEFNNHPAALGRQSQSKLAVMKDSTSALLTFLSAEAGLGTEAACGCV
jgi:hypothetical protein